MHFVTIASVYLQSHLWPSLHNSEFTIFFYGSFNILSRAQRFLNGKACFADS